ncbi:unnamed protein product [Oikopleura dioica]|uniref:Uncharacterized protein n=1 Tax=Oikopleura dioica TaxID=34765 RepID=E4WQQ1_OIKDI|nr:unnamed protein product [Oikopleura dioica]
MNSQKEEAEEIETPPVPKARASAPVVLSTVQEKALEANDAEKSEDIHVGLRRHDYKTLSNTPKMKEYEASDRPRKLIKPHDYEMPIAEVTKVDKNTPASPSKISSSNSPYSVKVLPKKRIGRVSAFDSIEEEPKTQPSPPKPPAKPTIIIEDDELPEAFRRPVLRKNKSKPPRPMSESVDYNPDLVEKLEGPALQRVLSLGPGERFKRSSIRRKKFFMGET